MSTRKRQKVMVTKFEQLSNEIIIMCFDYFDFYRLYQVFFGLNQRLNRLIQYEAKIYVDLNSFLPQDFLTFCLNLSQLNKNTSNYPRSLTTYSEENLKLIFYDNLLKDRFTRIKSLSVASMKFDTLYRAIFNEETKLYKTLERLTLSDEIGVERNENDVLLNSIISSKMESLKYLELNLRPYSCGCDHCLYMLPDFVDLTYHLSDQNSLSYLETLTIGRIPEDDEGVDEVTTKISFDTLTKELLPSLPKLKSLAINEVHFNEDNYERNRHLFGLQPKAEKKMNFPKDLRSVRIWISQRQRNGNNIQRNMSILEDFFSNNKSFSSANLKKFFIDGKNMLQQ